MKSVRWLAIALVSASLLVPVLVEARAGSGGNFGSRGTRTYSAPRPTAVAPVAKPVERSATPQQPAQPPGQQPAAAPQPSPQVQPQGFLSRNPLVSGLLGGVLGAGLMGMMFGGGYSGGGGFGGMGGGLMQLLIIGGLMYLVVRALRGAGRARVEERRPDYGFLDNATPSPVPDVRSMPYRQPELLAPSSSNLAMLPAAPTADLGINEADYKAFEAVLVGVQAAYSAADLAKLRGLASPEIVGYFSEALSGNVSRGVENKVEAVKLEQGELSEAWSEAGLEYASIAMRFSMIDFTRNVADGSIVSGSDHDRTEATEVWTFLRSAGGKWIVSAIQQT
jgi:predicted lipid-binding transport protein (Tim44 family)